MFALSQISEAVTDRQTGRHLQGFHAQDTETSQLARDSNVPVGTALLKTRVPTRSV
jgi:hypothetical protein